MGALLLDEVGRIVFLDAGVRSFMRSLRHRFPIASLSSAARRLSSQDEREESARSFLLDDGRRLEARLLLTRIQGAEALVLLKLRPASPSSIRARLKGLTEKEAAVVAQVVEGKTNPWIAAVEGRSVDCIKSRLRCIYRKLGVIGKTALVSLVLRGGAPPAPPSPKIASGDPRLIFEERATEARLSPAEKETASFVLQGKKNDEIARALGIEPPTVGVRLSKVYRKTGTKGRGELAAFLRGMPVGRAAVRAGL